MRQYTHGPASQTGMPQMSGTNSTNPVLSAPFTSADICVTYFHSKCAQDQTPVNITHQVEPSMREYLEKDCEAPRIR